MRKNKLQLLTLAAGLWLIGCGATDNSGGDIPSPAGGSPHSGGGPAVAGAPSGAGAPGGAGAANGGAGAANGGAPQGGAGGSLGGSIGLGGGGMSASGGTGGAGRGGSGGSAGKAGGGSSAGGPSSGGATSVGKFVGNITTGSGVDTGGMKYSKYWDQITPENAGKWGSVQGSASSAFNWSSLDAIYSYTETNHIIFKQHVFVWGSQQPSGTPTLAQIENWMKSFCERYPNTRLIDVE